MTQENINNPTLPEASCRLNVLVLGVTGLLGNAVYKYLNSIPGFDVKGTYRTEESGNPGEDITFEAGGLFTEDKQYYISALFEDFAPDYVVNCIGIIKPHIDKDRNHSVLINAQFPRLLSSVCKTYYNTKLIQPSSDCCYNGQTLDYKQLNHYTENSTHDCRDFYGKTKSLGEPEDCMVLRTSIIGEEIGKGWSLLEWVRSQKGNKINGFGNHFWQGVTTKQFAICVQKIIEQDLYKEEAYNLCSPKEVNKFDLVGMINKKYDLGITIEYTHDGKIVDRSLGTVKDLNAKLNIPSIQEQIDQL